MRQIFTSQRIETVEGVAALLEKNGIDTYISNGRSYQGRRGGQFSYSEPIGKHLQPTVWVRHADDQPKARLILREQGLLESTRPGQSRLPEFADGEDSAGGRHSWAVRIRLVLLALIVAAAAFTFLRHRNLRQAVQQPSAAAQAQPQAAPPETGLKADEERIRIPTLPQSAPPSGPQPGPHR